MTDEEIIEKVRTCDTDEEKERILKETNFLEIYDALYEQYKNYIGQLDEMFENMRMFFEQNKLFCILSETGIVFAAKSAGSVDEKLLLGHGKCCEEVLDELQEALNE